MYIPNRLAIHRKMCDQRKTFQNYMVFLSMNRNCQVASLILISINAIITLSLRNLFSVKMGQIYPQYFYNLLI